MDQPCRQAVPVSFLPWPVAVDLGTQRVSVVHHHHHPAQQPADPECPPASVLAVLFEAGSEVRRLPEGVAEVEGLLDRQQQRVHLGQRAGMRHLLLRRVTPARRTQPRVVVAEASGHRLEVEPGSVAVGLKRTTQVSHDRIS